MRNSDGKSESCVKDAFHKEAAMHENATRFAPSLLRRALAAAKSFTIDNMKRDLYNYDRQELYKIMQKYAAPSAFYERTNRKCRCFDLF